LTGGYCLPLFVPDLVMPGINQLNHFYLQMKITLTKRQIEMLNLIAHGFTSSEIAGLISVSIRTVESTRKTIVSKLQVNNATEAVSKAISYGILEYKPKHYGELRLKIA
jgi:DNA-binding NarL/FixJ family response regulator